MSSSSMLGGLLPELREHVPLAPLTTFDVGGEARFFLDAGDEETVEKAVDWAKRNGCSVTVLGGGSNVLVSDRGVDGLVLRVRIRGIAERHAPGAEGRVLVEIGAGEGLDESVAFAVAAGHAGVECLSGIPGYVGAAPMQNVGAYGQEIGETIVAVRALDRATGKIVVFDNADCRFSYRNSAFKEELRDRCVVLGVTLALVPNGSPRVRYPELVRALAPFGGESSSLSDVRNVVLSLRRSKGMVIDGSATDLKSAGSFFVNPVVLPDEADAIEDKAPADSALREAMPRFPAEGGVKLSAAWLIERAGFPKGTADGPVGISARHALAVVNRGGASAADIASFAVRVREAVQARFGIALSPEPVLVGFSKSEAAALGQ